MKTILIALIILLFISGYLYYSNSFIQKPKKMEVMPVETVVPPSTSTSQSASAQIATFTNNEHAFSFEYRIKPYGYSIFENNQEQNTEQGTLFGVTLVRTTDYTESVKASADGYAYDGPPAMSVYIFAAAVGTNLSQWLVQNNLLSNCVEGSVMPLSVAGEAGVSCLWDGLYAGETRAVLKADKIFLLTGTRENMETSDGYSYAKDFMDVVESFTLTN